MAQPRKIKKKVFLAAFLAGFCACHAAYAVSITNLSGQPQVVDIEDRASPSGFVPVEIANNATYRTPGSGDINVRYHGRPSRLEYTIDYAIWKEGGISPQKTNTPATKIQ